MKVFIPFNVKHELEKKIQDYIKFKTVLSTKQTIAKFNNLKKKLLSYDIFKQKITMHIFSIAAKLFNCLIKEQRIEFSLNPIPQHAVFTRILNYNYITMFKNFHDIKDLSIRTRRIVE